MSVVYSLGDEDTRKQLLDGLIGTLQGGQFVFYITFVATTMHASGSRLGKLRGVHLQQQAL